MMYFPKAALASNLNVKKQTQNFISAEVNLTLPCLVKSQPEEFSQLL